LSPLRSVSLVPVMLLAACNAGLQRPALPELDPQARFSAAAPGADAAGVEATHWWRNAVAEKRWAFIEKAVTDNPEARAAEARTVAARAQLARAEAASGPSLDLRAGAQVQRLSGDTSNNRTIGLDGAVPIDINNAIGLRVEAARAELRAAEADTRQLRSDLARDLILAMIDGAEAQQRYQLLDSQIDVAKTLLRLTELRFSLGLAASVDVLQQRDQLAALHQQLPIATLDRHRAGNNVRLIAGMSPGRMISVPEDLPRIDPNFVQVEPAQLLQRRSALRASQARLAAADAEFAAALADRWPTLQLSAGTLSRAAAGDLTSVLSAALDAAVSLFDSGERRAIAAQRRAELVTAGERLLSDWLDAVIEVDDLIHTEASLRERIALSSERLETARALLRAAQRRYERGISDYLPVLEALRGLQQQQRDHLALRAELARSRVRLHRSLGDPVAQESL